MHALWSQTPVDLCDRSPSAITKASASATLLISGLNFTAHALAVYASRRRLPTCAQDSLSSSDHLLSRTLTSGLFARFRSSLLLAWAWPGAP